ncbi:palindromic element RPE1 domain-containing protein [Rickettsia sibirica]|nr:palindromic element RPE1 domain-containing protein [Rickettsia sibirica]
MSKTLIDIFPNTYRDEFKGDTKALVTATYKLVREDTSLGLMYKLPLEAKFEKMSNAYNRYREYVEDGV